MDTRRLGRTNLAVSRVGLGSFKIGRNQRTKYPGHYELPDPRAVETLLNGVLDLGVNLIDTAPAYGLAEERIGQALAHRRREFVLSTKVGENFDDGKTSFDFSANAVRDSIERSLRRLRTDVLDIVFIHSSGDDLHVLRDTPVVETLIDCRSRGLVRAVGLSGKTLEGERDAMSWADALMVEYNLANPHHAGLIEEAASKGVGVVVKKALGSGNIPANEALRFLAPNPHIASVVIGTLSLDHLRSNIKAINA